MLTDLETRVNLSLAAEDARELSYHWLGSDAEAFHNYQVAAYVLKDVEARLALFPDHPVQIPEPALSVALEVARSTYQQHLEDEVPVMTKILPWDVAVHVLEEVRSHVA